MSNLLLIFMVLHLPAACYAQPKPGDSTANTTYDSTRIIIQVPQGSSMHSDYLENIYIISPNNDISKYDKNGKLLATANFKVLGNVSSIDAGNPFEIYVFYRDQNKILFLDNMLNLRGECDLETIGVSQIGSIARSADNQIWLFDMSDLKLKKYSKDLKLLSESAAFNTLINDKIISPSQIVDINSSLLILNNNSILEFDIFANFSRVLLYDTIQKFQFSNGLIYFLKNRQICSYNKDNFKYAVHKQELPSGSSMMRIEKDSLFILRDRNVILQSLSEAR